jgi:hypothetical protein
MGEHIRLLGSVQGLGRRDVNGIEIRLAGATARASPDLDRRSLGALEALVGAGAHFVREEAAGALVRLFSHAQVGDDLCISCQFEVLVRLQPGTDSRLVQHQQGLDLIVTLAQPVVEHTIQQLGSVLGHSYHLVCRPPARAEHRSLLLCLSTLARRLLASRALVRRSSEHSASAPQGRAGPKTSR